MALAGLTAGPAVAQAARTGWVGAGPDSEGFRKLLFAARGENESIIYFRCRSGDGWTFLTANAGATQAAARSLVLSSGAVTERPSFRVRPDELEGGFYFDAAVAADNRLFDAMKAGNALSVNGTRFPVATPAERRTIAAFTATCLGGQ